MVGNESAITLGQNRPRSLRREWTRAFILLLALVLGTGACTVVGVWQVVNQFSGAATQRDRETNAEAKLRIAWREHEKFGHYLVSGQPVDRAAFLHQQANVEAAFAQALAIFPAGNGTRETLRRAHQQWEQSLSAVGIWGDQALTKTGVHMEENPALGLASEAGLAVLNDLEAPSIHNFRQGLDNGKKLERYVLVLLVGLFAMAAGVTWHFRRKMSRDLLRPVATMREGAHKLRSGDLEHHIPIARNDELGELAEAFNSMADALHDNQRALIQRATHDALTGLANRAALTEHLVNAFDPDAAKPTSCGALLFIDVDDFKDVNDSLGHEAGDFLLIELVGRLKSCVGPDDLVSRLGGDEFAISIGEAEGRRGGREVADRILEALETPVIINETSVAISVSIGVAERRPETSDSAELLRQADFAMYMAKGGGKGRYQVFDAQMHDIMAGRSALKADLTKAVTQQQLRLDYQPITELAGGRIVGLEALVRWQHPTLGLLPPDDFIALAEETGDIDAIGRWVLQTAVDQIVEWRGGFADYADLWVSVNLSAFQLPNPRSLATLQHILSDPDLSAGAVVLEITETALASDLHEAVTSLEALRNSGARIAVDDFGTGFSSLASLASLPVDILKIDRSFVSGRGRRAPSVPILEGIIELAHKLSLDLIAEGIEEPEQLELLQTLGCPLGQGFLLARPAPPEEITARLSAGTTASTPLTVTGSPA
jgi:diguanylate cyclase (GGDEF)-like protein